ncbi:signal recognition particle-docking protein FtsY [uncultured Methanobrevibacter sp.]|uniref:signal recognition particle-docking protein FtsY n=1 Tax=uncultured Methanobrevibacter sp. TaxID=253161 RepID=UPI0025D68D85|nr:signal recognition particle-docking protein FtsY [uncultured Methanobrevibacter sp.]
MFESLKKKFSRTSEKLEEELIEEAEAEDNLKEESGSRFSFFSFGRKKKEEQEEDDDNLLPQAEESVEDAPIAEEETEDAEEEKKSHFWSRNKDDDEEEEAFEDEEEEAPEEVEEVKEEKKSHFWSRNKDKDEEEDSQDDEEEEAPEEEKKSHFWNRNKDKEDVSADGEASGGIFSFVREKTIQEKHVEDILFELEMELLQGDVAMEVATDVVESVKDNLVGKKIKRSNDITEYTYFALKDAVYDIINIPGKSMTEMLEEKKAQGEPLVVMFVGINGTGKTTTIGKLANYYLKKGYTPVIAASDTFRAGAIEQVTHHADNVGVKIIKHQKGSDPAAVAFDAVEHARAQGKDLVLIDTAGRMQTNTNLMDEMKKIKRVSNPDLVIFVGDAITGNDATEQARKFNEAIDIDGVILTKADADSKGGASLSIGYVIKKPIMFLGVGQGYDDIMEYDSEWMLNQLFSDDEGIAEDA